MDSLLNIRNLLLVCAALTGLPAATAAVREASPVIPNIVTPLDTEERLYIVQLDGPPALVAAGVHRETPTRGLFGTTEVARFDPNDDVVRMHADRLRTQQDALLHSINAWNDRVYSYRYTFNGMAIKLTPQQADKLRLRKGVAKVWEDRRRRVSTSDSPAFLGLLDANGGLRSDLGLQGEDIIIGVIDSGIRPGHPSVAERALSRDKPRLCQSEWAETSLLGRWLCRRFDRPGNLLFGAPPEDWRGVCEVGEGFTLDDCNNKLIGARFYNEGFLADGPADVNEFVSPADADGHGTHIASIAAGNSVNAQVFGRDVGRISGMAPRARIAVYKACWLEPGGFRATCSVADLQAAIEDAVADGVDIINYSIGDLDDSLTDPDDLALLAAFDAGVLSVAASGNNGPEPFTILAPATTPWVISVGATTRTGNRVAEGLRVNKPESVASNYESREASFTPLLRDRGPLTADLILVADGNTITPEGAIGTVYDACSGLSNGDEISNNIAFVQRGGCDFDTKVRFAQDAGAIAVVVFNNDDELTVMAGNSAAISIPAVMMGQADGQLLRDKLAEGDTVELTLDKAIFIDFSETGNVMGSFSGRGPSLGDPNFLKPDLVAPGVNILGGNTPDIANGFRGELYQYLSGTSQAVPHVAGVAALLREAHPDWSPSALKSALMTSARQDIRATTGGALATPFDMGAGHIVPNSAFDPGLLYEISSDEYDAYLCSINLARISDEQCAQLVSLGLDIDAQDVNLPSIAITELVATQEVVRRVRNPGAPAIFTVSVDEPDGLTVEVEPETLTLGADETAEYVVRFSSDGSRLNEWLFGSLSWTDATRTVYSPFAVQPTDIYFDDLVSASGTAGTANVRVDFGYDGAYRAAVFGLELPCVLPDNTADDEICTNTAPAIVGNDPLDNYEFTESELSWVSRFFIRVNADDDALFRVALFDELTDGQDDLDLYLYYCVDSNADGNCEDTIYLGASQNVGTSDELIDIDGPPAGVYILDVHGYDTDTAFGAGARFCVYSWAFGTEDPAGNLALAGDPGIAAAGTSANLSLTWDSLADGFWLGGISHLRGTNTLLGTTLAEINNNGLPEPPTVEDGESGIFFTCP